MEYGDGLIIESEMGLVKKRGTHAMGEMTNFFWWVDGCGERRPGGYISLGDVWVYSFLLQSYTKP